MKQAKICFKSRAKKEREAKKRLYGDAAYNLVGNLKYASPWTLRKLKRELQDFDSKSMVWI